MADGDDDGMSSKPLGPGALVGGYRLEVRVGAGQMGVVWRAVRTSDGAVAAVKVLRDDLVSDHDLVRRFTRERDALLRVSGPHVASLRDLILEGDRIALVTEYLAGGDLRRWLDRHGPQPAAEAAVLAIQVFDGLASVHGSGIVHRDVKPANILLKDDQSEPELVLADFSLAHLAGATITRHSHAVMGTPMYLAPEVIKGTPATPAADLYAAGIVLYELLAGAPPFAGDHPWAVMHAHVEQEPPRPPDCPDRLWQILAALLTKDPEDRPDTAADARDQLHEAIRALEEADGPGPGQDRSREIAAAAAEGAVQGAAEAMAEHAVETMIDEIQGDPQPPPGPGESTEGPGNPEPGVPEPSSAPPRPDTVEPAEPPTSAEPEVSAEIPSHQAPNPDPTGNPPPQPEPTPDPTSVKAETAGTASGPSNPAAHPTPGTKPPPDPATAAGGSTVGTSAGAGASAGSTSAWTGIASVVGWVAGVAAIVGVTVGLPALVNAATSTDEDTDDGYEDTVDDSDEDDDSYSYEDDNDYDDTVDEDYENDDSYSYEDDNGYEDTVDEDYENDDGYEDTVDDSDEDDYSSPIPAAADVGECVEIDPAFTDVVAVGACQPGSSATYRVAAVVDPSGSCPNSQQAYMSSGDFVLCLDLNLYEKYCYERREDSGRVHITAVACGGSTAWHVMTIIPGATGAQAGALCPPTATAFWEFYAPQMVACVGAS